MVGFFNMTSFSHLPPLTCIDAEIQKTQMKALSYSKVQNGSPFGESV